MSELRDRILFVDDQAEITQLLARQIGSTYDVVFAGSGAAALAALDTEGPFAVVVADYSMPNMDGVTLLAEVKRRAPDTVLIMLTAFAEIDVAVAALHEGHIYRFLRKPWEKFELERALADALDHHHLVASEKRLRAALAGANAALDAKVRELDQTNQLLEYWVEFSPAVLYSADVLDGAAPRLTYVSKNFVRLCGHERTSVIVDPTLWQRLIDPAEAEAQRVRLQQFVASTASEFVASYTITHRTGEQRRILDSVRCIRNPQGRALELVGAWLDLSALPVRD